MKLKTVEEKQKERNYSIQSKNFCFRPDHFSIHHWRDSVAAFASGASLPIDIALGLASIHFLLHSSLWESLPKKFTAEQKKEGLIKLLAQSKLRSIVDITS